MASFSSLWAGLCVIFSWLGVHAKCPQRTTVLADHLPMSLQICHVCCINASTSIWQTREKTRWSVFLKPSDDLRSFLRHVGRILVVDCHLVDKAVVVVSWILWNFAVVVLAALSLEALLLFLAALSPTLLLYWLFRFLVFLFKLV